MDLYDCVDLRELNHEVKRERFTLPTPEDITAKLKGATIFSTLAASSGYHQIRLTEESSKLTFLTTLGRYKYNRLPFGITSASEIFQRRVTEMLQGVPGTAFTMMTF